MLLHFLFDVLMRMNLSMAKLQDQCYDGVSYICTCLDINQVLQQVIEEEQREIYMYMYMHSYGHTLNLACSDSTKQHHHTCMK